MAEIQLPNEITKALQDFFQNKDITVYEAGLEEDRPSRIQDRPFFDVVPESETTWLANKEGAKTAGSYKLALGAEQEPNTNTLDTESHKFIQDVEKRFRDLQPNAKLFIIDPDVVMGRYAMDTSRDRSIGKSMVEFLHDKLTENNITEHKAEPGDESVFVPASITGNSPFSMPLPTGVTEENLAGTGKICVVVASNPDKIMHDLWTRVPGSEERMAELGIDFDSTRRMVLYHELGHSMDIWSDKGVGNPITNNNIVDQTLRRHRTECLADTFATLQVARDFKSTATPELMADLRACFAYEGFKEDSPEHRAKMKMFSILGDERKKHEKTKKLEKKMGIAEVPTKATKDVLKLEETAKDFEVLKSIGMTLAYNVTPITDVAIKVAKEGLKDGSLLKMTDKEVLELAEKIVEENAFDKNRLNQAAMDILTGNKENPDLKAIENRYQQALSNMPLPASEMAKRLEEKQKKQEEAITKQLRKQLHLKVEDEIKPKGNPEEVASLLRWVDNVYDNIERKGGNLSAIVSSVSEEKDKLRVGKSADKLYDKKLAILDVMFINQAPEVELGIKASAAVAKSIEALDVKIDGLDGVSGVSLINAFIQYEMGNAKKCVENIAAKQEVDYASMDIVELNKVQAKENQEYVGLLSGEKISQALAVKIRTDKEAWKVVSGSEKMRDLVTKKALGRPSDWLASYHISLIERSRDRQEDVLSNIGVSNMNYASAVKEINKKASQMNGVDKTEIVSVKPQKTAPSMPNVLMASKLSQR
ncbi:MAG: hypothetical protein AB7U85_06385 [Alphaproteobacteria bacterium]